MMSGSKGRPTKPGLDYSQIDCDYSRKPLALQVRKKFGLEGIAVIYEVIAWINEGKGCYVECESVDDAADQFATSRLFDYNLSGWVESVFMFMLEIGFFDPNALARDHILTSEGITRRWYEAKRSGWESKKRPCPYDLPESVQNYISNFSTPKYPENTPKYPENTPKCAETAENTPKTAQKCNKVKESKNKQPNTQPTEPTSEETSEETPQQPDVLTEAKANPRWTAVRLRIARKLYSPSLSADLIDWFTVAGLNQWIKPDQIGRWKREALDEIELFQRSNGRKGKAKLWEVLRPKLEDAFAPHGITLPSCDPKRREPPPPPENTEGRDPATAASRRV